MSSLFSLLFFNQIVVKFNRCVEK